MRPSTLHGTSRLSQDLCVKFNQHLKPSFGKCRSARLISYSTAPSSDTVITSPRTFTRRSEKLPELYSNFSSDCTGTKLSHLRLGRAGSPHQSKESLPLKTCEHTPGWAHLSTADTQQYIQVFMIKKIISFYYMLGLSLESRQSWNLVWFVQHCLDSSEFLQGKMLSALHTSMALLPVLCPGHIFCSCCWLQTVLDSFPAEPIPSSFDQRLCLGTNPRTSMTLPLPVHVYR